MPSFFEGLKRLVTGQPVFKASDLPPEQRIGDAPVAPPAGPVVAPQNVSTGPKVPPRVTIEEVECRTSGDDMECTFRFKNESHVQVDLDKFTLFGSSRDLGTFLRPGEEREIKVYSGDRPKNTAYNRCELQFKDPTGDYFQMDYYIEYQGAGDGTYTIRRLTSNARVRDI